MSKNGRMNGKKQALSTLSTIPRNQNITRSSSSRILRGTACMLGIPALIRRWTSLRANAACRAITFCIRSDGMRSDCQAKTMRSKIIFTLPLSQSRISRGSSGSFSRWDFRLTGRARLIRRTRSTTNGPSGSFSSYSSMALLIKKRWPSTGALPASASSPTRKSSTACASAAAAKSCAR